MQTEASTPTGQPCPPDCSIPLVPPAPLSLEEVLSRFQRDARPGVCDTGRYRCPYYVWGEGPPLLLIPGLADDTQSFVFLMAYLAPHFRCVAYDLPSGRGDGARLGRYTHADLVADALALMDHLQLARSYVFGSSFGATVALEALRTRPERLPRAILQGGFAWRPLELAENLGARLFRYVPGMMKALPLRAATLYRTNAVLFAHRPPEVWDFFLERSNAHPIAAVAHRALMVHRLDLRATLAEVRQPVLLVCGDKDPLVSRACEEVLLRGLPNAARVQLDRCGHNPLFTHPEVLAEVVRLFLTPP